VPDRSRDGFTLGIGWLLSRAYRHSLMCAACSEGRSKTAMVTASLSAACSALTPSGWCRELMGVELEEPGLEPRGDLWLLLLLLLLEERDERDERISPHSTFDPNRFRETEVAFLGKNRREMSQVIRRYLLSSRPESSQQRGIRERLRRSCDKNALFHARPENNLIAERRRARWLFSSVQFHRGPPTLTPPPSQRTAPLPSVNTSTEYSLARATQFC
jgi:hypothetical protein